MTDDNYAEAKFKSKSDLIRERDAAEQRAVEAERRADKVGAYVDDLRADWQDAEKRAEAAAEERDDRRRMHESADVRAQAAEADRDRLRDALSAVQQYLRSGAWRQHDGVDNIISQALASPTPSAAAVVRAQYDELIYAVGNKWPGETRHETALRYIREAEKPQGTADPGSALPAGREDQ